MQVFFEINIFLIRFWIPDVQCSFRLLDPFEVHKFHITSTSGSLVLATQNLNSIQYINTNMNTVINDKKKKKTVTTHPV